MTRTGPIAIGLLGTSVALGFAAAAPGLIDDDAYIFLRYAQHLAAGQGMSFNLGEPSAGVTSALWVLLLAAGHWLTGVELITLAQTLGACCFGLALTLMTRAVISDGHRPVVALVAGAVAALSPVFVCQAVSGMEVGLNMLLVAVAGAWLGRRTFTPAVAAGLSFVTRPDNLLLAPLVVAWRAPRDSFARAVTVVAASLLVFGLPWVLYCYIMSGSLLPPTRTGKLLVFMPGWYDISAGTFADLPLTARLAVAGRGLQRVALLFTEGQARSLLLWMIPLLPFGLALVGRRLLMPLVLFVLLALAYAAAFPLVKLRYFVHLWPWLVPVALIGAARRLPPRLLHPLFALLVLGHIALCVRAWPRYRDWVACDGTKTLAGKWLAEHTAPSARLALEPIGAIGYHSRRYIVDLGGLIAPDIWPVIRNGPAFDPDEMLSYLRTRRTDYLIDAVDGPWAHRLLQFRPESLHLEARIPGRAGCGIIGVYSVAQ